LETLSVKIGIDMPKSTNRQCMMFCLLLIFGLVFACGGKGQENTKPKVVSQKISVPQKTSPPEKVVQSLKTPTNSVSKQVLSGVVAPPETQTVPQPILPAAGEKQQQAARLLASIKQDQPLLVGGAVYNPEGRIDPFIPLFKEETKASAVATRARIVNKPKRTRREPTTPLEKIDLSQLTLVATIRAPSGDKAMVEDTSGRGYIVNRGTYIGINSGSVVDVLKDRIIVEEEVETVLGDINIQKRELKLQKPAGE
jgi:type IV pilus assembly protein PilP